MRTSMKIQNGNLLILFLITSLLSGCILPTSATSMDRGDRFMGMLNVDTRVQKLLGGPPRKYLHGSYNGEVGIEIGRNVFSCPECYAPPVGHLTEA